MLFEITLQGSIAFFCVYLVKCGSFNFSFFLHTRPEDVDGLVSFMIDNFNRNYKTNKAPFGFFVHSAWFMVGQNHFAAFVKFIDYLQGLPDVYLVTILRTFLPKIRK